MADKEAQLVVSFTEGITEGVAEEVASGVIRRSENTRLTKLKGTPSRRPKEVVIGTQPVLPVPTCGGMAMGVRESVAAYFKPAAFTKRIIDTTVEAVVASSLGVSGENAYYPYPLIDSGIVGTGPLGFAPATCFDAAGLQWFVTGRSIDATTVGVFVSVIDGTKERVTPRVIHTQATFVNWVGITPCTGGVIVWYDGTVGIVCRKVTLPPSGILSVSVEHAMFTPLEPGGVVQADVVSDGVNTAWLLSRASAVLTDASLRSYDLTTFGVISQTALLGVITNNTDPVYFCVNLFSSAGGTRLAVAISDFGGNCYRAVHNSSTLAANWSNNAADGYGPVSALPYVQSGIDSVIYALSKIGPLGVGFDETTTIFQERARPTGTLRGTVKVPWYGLQSKGVAHFLSSTETYPYFPLFARWGPAGASPSVPGGAPTNFMDTPQIIVVTPYAPDSTQPVAQYTPVMRCGVDRVSQWSNVNGFNSAPSTLSATGRFGLTYLADRFDLPPTDDYTQTSYYVVFDLAASWQPATAADVGPVGILAAGLVAVWDGLETTEYAPFTRPKIAVDPTTGAGPALTGTYLYTAVVSWVDAAGNIRRSAPALPVTVELTAESPTIYVTMPLTMRNGVRQTEFDITLYATVAGGSIFYSLPSIAPTKGVLGCWKYAFVYDTDLEGAIQLYSMGGANEPLLPECPPPAWDIRAIVGRLWLIDAENRYRLLPSMLKQDGNSIEFNSNLAITTFDQQYGKLVAVVDVGGNPFILAERGIWRVDGYGPDNAGQGGSFTDPALVMNVGCRARHSVAQVPAVGVLFQCNDGRFALLTGGIERFETFGVYDVGPPTIHLLQNEVIYPLADGSGYIVFNWLARGWTKWPTATRVLPSATMLQTDVRSRTYYYASDGSFLTLDSDSIDTDITRPLLVERGWVAPEGPHGDCVIREFWVHCIYNTPHSIRVRASFDYDSTSFVEQTWTNLELVPLLQDGRYTVGMNTEAMPVRALRVLVEVTPAGTAEGGQPLTLVVLYGASAGIRRRTLLEGALK